MGNLDLVVIINGQAYLVKGSAYSNDEADAIQLAMGMHKAAWRERMANISAANQKELLRDKEELLAKISSDGDIKTIKVLVLAN